MVSFNPEIVLVPAPVMVNVPVIVGTFKESPDQQAIFTPGVIVTFSVTLSLKKIVSPEEAAVIALAKVVWVPLAAEVATTNFVGP